MGSAATMMAQAYANGGKVAGKGKGDKVRTLLDPREVVLPPDTVKAVGLSTLKALIAATHKHVTTARGRVRRMANGGLVGDDPDEQQKPTLSYGQQMANVGGAVVGAAGRVAKEVFSAPPDAASPSGYGLNRLGSPTVTVPAAAPTAQRALPAGTAVSDAGAGRGALNPPLASATGDARPDLATVPNLQGSTGVAVAGAPGVRRLTATNGSTLYSNVPGSDNDKLMSASPGVQVVPGGVPAGAATALATPTAAPASYIPGVNAPDSQYTQETNARNAQQFSVFGRGGSRQDLQREEMGNQRAIAQMTTQAGLQGHEIAAGASRYGADVGANTAAQKLAVEAPEAIAKAQASRAILAAQEGYSTALKTGDQDKIKAAEDQLRASQGKWERNFPDIFKTTALPATVGVDGTRTPSGAIVTDSRSGDTRIIYGKELQAEQALPAGLVVGASTKQADGAYTVGTKKVTIKGGKVSAIE